MLRTIVRYLRQPCSYRGARPVGTIARDKSGNVLPMMAAGILVLAGLVGGGVDMARAYKAERRLQAACDAATLAGRRAVSTDGFDATVQQQANAYFTANFTDAEQETRDTSFVPSSPDDGATVVGTATTSLNTVIMKIFGFNDFDLQVTCSASMGVGNSDVVFVLDTTGSMLQEPNGTSPEDGEDNKLQSLQASMKDFYDTVDTSVAGSNARIRYGFVPYSSAVNVGRLLNDLDASYISDSVTVQSVDLVDWSATPINTWSDPGFTYTSTQGNWWDITGRYDDTDDCEDDLPSNTAWVDTGSPSNTVTYSVETDTGHQIKTTGVHQPQERTEYRCKSRRIQQRTATRQKRSSYYEERTQVPVTTHDTSFTDAVLQQRTFDVSTYKTFASTTIPVDVRNSGQNTDYDDTTTWEGCIMERETTPASSFSFVSLATGITPSTAQDLDIDAAPTGDDASKWKVLWPEITFRRDEDYTFEAVDKDGSGIDEDELDNASSACPYQAQLLEEMEEADFDAYVDLLNAEGNTYHDIGLLWGARLASPTGIWADVVNEEADNGGTVSRHLIFMTDGVLQPSLTVNSSYGIEELDKRITGNGDDDDQWDNHRSRFLAICEAVKARGIRLWVIAFGTSLSGDLITCATDGLASAFQANDADELDEHFQEIANQVGELRITQ